MVNMVAAKQVRLNVGAAAGVALVIAVAWITVERPLAMTIGLGGAALLAEWDRLHHAVPALPTALVGAVFAAAVVVDEPSSAWSSMIAGAVGVTEFAVPLFLVAMLSRNRIVGGGDVRLATLLGLALGVTGSATGLVALVLFAVAWVLVGVFTAPGTFVPLGWPLVLASVLAIVTVGAL